MLLVDKFKLSGRRGQRQAESRDGSAAQSGFKISSWTFSILKTDFTKGKKQTEVFSGCFAWWGHKRWKGNAWQWSSFLKGCLAAPIRQGPETQQLLSVQHSCTNQTCMCRKTQPRMPAAALRITPKHSNLPNGHDGRTEVETTQHSHNWILYKREPALLHA